MLVNVSLLSYFWGCPYSTEYRIRSIPAANWVSPVLMAAARIRKRTCSGFVILGVGLSMISNPEGEHLLGATRDRIVGGILAMLMIFCIRKSDALCLIPMNCKSELNFQETESTAVPLSVQISSYRRRSW